MGEGQGEAIKRSLFSVFDPPGNGTSCRSCERCLLWVVWWRFSPRVAGVAASWEPRRSRSKSKSLQSEAAEGALLAEDAVAGKTTRIYMREHSSVSSKAASESAASLKTAEDRRPRSAESSAG